MLKKSHTHYIVIGTSRAYSFRRALSHRFHGPLPRRSKKTISSAIRCQCVFSSHRPMLRPTNWHAILARVTCVQPMPTTASESDGSSSQPPRYIKEPARKRHHAQLLSGFLKNVPAALGMYSCVNLTRAPRETRLDIRVIRTARKRSRVLKVVHAVRRRHHYSRTICRLLASTAFAVFIVYDVQNLAQDEPIGGKDKNTIREDPAAALSDAREELARMMKEDRSRCR